MKKQKGKCYYCGKDVVDDVFRNAYYSSIKRPVPLDTATLEHLYPQFDIRRLMVDNYDKLVVACYKCNEDADYVFQGIARFRYSVNILQILKTGNIFVCEYPSTPYLKRELGMQTDEVKEYNKSYIDLAIVGDS